MDRDEIAELSGIESKDDCCIFCQSKCLQCGSVNIEVEYHRIYQIIDSQLIFSESSAYVCCHQCNSETENAIYQLPEGISSSGNVNIEYEIISNKDFIPNPEIAKQVDQYFEKDDAIRINSELSDKAIDEGIEKFVIIYQYENRTRNEISIEKSNCYFIDESGNEFSDKMAIRISSLFETDYLSLTCEDDPNGEENHYVVSAKKIRILN